MRKIIFRGKDFKSGEWVYGDFSTSVFLDKKTGIVAKGYFIEDVENYQHHVLEETIGQFAGLYSSLEPLYEGDIILTEEGNKKVIVFDDCAFRLASFDEYLYILKGEHPFINDYATLTPLSDVSMQPFKLIGNVHDNLELIISDSKLVKGA